MNNTFIGEQNIELIWNILQENFRDKMDNIIFKEQFQTLKRQISTKQNKFKNLIEMNPSNYPISMLYARALMHQKQYGTAEEALKKLLLKRKDDPQVWYWLAEVQGLARKIIALHQSRAEYFYLTGNYDRAIEHLRYALELAGNNFQLNEVLQTKIENVFATQEELKDFT